MSDAWSKSQVSHRPGKPVYYIVDSHIFGLAWLVDPSVPQVGRYVAYWQYREKVTASDKILAFSDHLPPLCLHFLGCKCWQIVTFLDHLPILSCKRKLLDLAWLVDPSVLQVGRLVAHWWCREKVMASDCGFGEHEYRPFQWPCVLLVPRGTLQLRIRLVSERFDPTLETNKQTNKVKTYISLFGWPLSTSSWQACGALAV